MIPLRDDRPGGGAPPLALLITAVALAAGIAADGGGVWLGLLAGLGAWLFAPSLVRELGAAPTVLVVSLGAVASGGLAAALGGPWQAWATVGGAGALVATHLVRFPGSSILGLIPIPLRAGLAEVPSAAVAAAWAVPVCLIAAGA